MDDDYNEDEDAYYEDDDYQEEEYEEDEDQVAYVDEEGWFHAEEEVINAIDEHMAQDNDEFAAILTNYTEARGALAKARIASRFYPVVVPADMGPQARYGRKGKGKRQRETQRNW